MKKNLIIVIALALVLGACSKSEVVRDFGRSDSISFTTYAGRPLVKAGSSFVSGGDFAAVAEPKINVWADLQGSDSAWTGNFNFMRDVEVTLLDGGNGKSLNYADIHYWPKNTEVNFLSFWAYYPSRDSHFTDIPSGLGDYEWTVDAQAAKQEDLMFAEAVIDQNRNSNDGTVNFTFHHQLTQVRFLVRKPVLAETVSAIRLDSLKIFNVDVKDTISTRFENHKVVAEWKGNGRGNASFTVSAAPQYVLEEAKPVGDVFLMLPQLILDGEVGDAEVQYAEIAYTIFYVNPSYSESVLESVPLYTSSVPSWNANQKINYIIEIGGSLQPVSFAGDVSAWEDESSSAIIVKQ